ncbi:hypothetical protein KSP39_PZI022067 [Platanthera zijinensis]|uniref:Uncharacterized protein n=1 Tax=Platanthera zijinensis TaxID=2320716 RepID=A0AAP0AXK7_9ASPA
MWPATFHMHTPCHHLPPLSLMHVLNLHFSFLPFIIIHSFSIHACGRPPIHFPSSFILNLFPPSFNILHAFIPPCIGRPLSLSLYFISFYFTFIPPLFILYFPLHFHLFHTMHVPSSLPSFNEMHEHPPHLSGRPPLGLPLF